MPSHATRLTPVATAKIKSVKLSGKTRVKRIRRKLRKYKKVTAILKRRVSELEAYSSRQENLVEKHEKFIEKCTANFPKVGPVPVVRCAECGKQFPLTHYRLRMPNCSTAKHWMVHAECKGCVYERNKRVDAKRKERTAIMRKTLAGI